jgi:hypothetical protein
VATLALTIATALGLAVLMHWWPRLHAAWRRRISLATSAAGIAFLGAALQAEGRRESALTSVVLVGPSTLTATTSASASLYYYVLTAFCLLLGFAGLAIGELLSRWLAPRWLLSSVAVAWLVTAVRFLLEKSAAPSPLAQAMGVTWLAPVAGAYFATALPPGPAFGSPSAPRPMPLVCGLVAFVGIGRPARPRQPTTTCPPTSVAAAGGLSLSFAPGSWQVF